MKKNNCINGKAMSFRRWKIFLIMKLLAIFILGFILQSNALDTQAQNKRLSLQFENKSLKEVLLKLEDQTEFSFIYKDEMINPINKVSGNFKDEKVTDLLNKVLQNTGLTYMIEGRAIVILSNDSESIIEQQKSISGKVTDSSGSPLPGVTVVVKGTSQGIITDSFGNYSLTNVPENATMQFSFVGMKTQEVTVGNKSTINIVLTEEATNIEEVVAVGYGIQKKINITGSVASVKSDLLVKAPVANATNTLAGRLPGLISKQTSGQPGADAASLSIRGFGGSLIIVDGVEGTLNNIDANQIESVSILKDGAGSIYGARAGNGVILITTKRGIDQKPIIAFNTSATLQGITTMPKFSNAGQYAEMERETWLQAGKPDATAPFTAAQVQKYYDGTDPQYPNTNWYDYLIRDWAPQQQHNLSVRGGSEKIKYYGFIGYTGQESMWKKNGGDYKRYNLQSNIDAKITDELSLQLDLSSAIETREYPSRPQSAGANTVWQDLWATLAIYPAELPDKSKISFANGGGTGGAHTVSNSAISGYNNSGNQDLRAKLALNYNFKFIPGLSAKASVNYNQQYNSSKEFNLPMTFYTYDVASKIYTKAGSLNEQARLLIGRSEARMMTEQFSFNYDRVFGEVHHISALGLFEIIDYKNDWLSAGRTNYLTAAIDQLFAGNSSYQSNNGAATEMGREGYVTRLNYSFKNKYLFEASFRADASAKFPSEKRWGYFPGASLGWVITNENFMKRFANLDNLKIRASYGQSGNDGVGNFQYLSGYVYGGRYMFNGIASQGLSSTGLANPELTWEKMSISNIGLDFSLWKRKLYGEGDVFYRTREGIPGTKYTTLPSTFGATLPPENINSLNDRGFELLLGNTGKRGDFSWDISANISWSRAKWDHYEEPDYSTDPDKERIYKVSGRWTDRGFGYLSDGLFTSQAEIDALKFVQDNQGNKSLRQGDIKYKDINNDGVLDWKDQVEIGKGNVPHWMLGFNLNLKYKNFDFSSLFQGALGYDYYINQPVTTMAQLYENRWTTANNDAHAFYPRLGGAATNGYGSDFYMKKASYIRLKTISIGYNLPNSWLQKFKGNQLRIYLAGTNLLTLDKLRKYDVDPEAPSGLIGRYYPQQKSITAGVNLSF